MTRIGGVTLLFLPSSAGEGAVRVRQMGIGAQPTRVSRVTQAVVTGCQ